jgi:hypothetical protein
MNENKTDMLNYWIEEILKYFNEIGFEYEPVPTIKFDETPNPEDELFIKTGFYDPTENKLVLFVDNRHIKDILRTFCHEMVHRNQNILDPEGFAAKTSNLPLAEDEELKQIESEAFLYGNLLFREFTERYTHK